MYSGLNTMILKKSLGSRDRQKKQAGHTQVLAPPASRGGEGRGASIGDGQSVK